MRMIIGRYCITGGRGRLDRRVAIPDFDWVWLRFLEKVSVFTRRLWMESCTREEI